MAKSLDNKFRIIAGQWRGRKISIPLAEGVRPTPDRVRETLFNWLANDIQGAHCLDAFAGSGALGFEALSRGAAKVGFRDRSNDVIQHLQQQVAHLDCALQADIQLMDWKQPLKLIAQPFDIVFLDPPFRENYFPALIERLTTAYWIDNKTIIYVEVEAEFNFASVLKGSHWQIARQKQAGQVTYFLLKWQHEETAETHS